MESKLCRPKNAIISLAKPKNKPLDKTKNTWSNLLSTKSASTNTGITLKNKSNKNSPIIEKTTTINKSVQCDIFNSKVCQNSTSLSVFNPIRTLQFLLKEITELPNVKNARITKIIDEMQVVVGRINDEFSENVPYSKFNMPVVNDNLMIPTRENDYCKDLRYENNPHENKYWLVLLGKVSELENSYSQLTENYTKSEKKLQCVTSERDKLLEQFKELCNSLEMLNKHEREYLDTIRELKSKLITSEKLISKQENIIINLNTRLNMLPKVKNQVKELINKDDTKQFNTCKGVLQEKDKFKQNSSSIKLNLDQLKITNNYKDHDVSVLRSDIKQMKQIMSDRFQNTDILMSTLKLEGNKIKDFSKFNEDNKNDIEHDIDIQYTEYNRQASAIKQAKTELDQLFKTIQTQTYISKKLFNSTTVDNERNLSDISDEDDNCSIISNFMSVVTDSSY